MLSLRVGPAELRALEPWRAPEFAAFMQRSGSSLYEWLPWERFEDVDNARAFLAPFAESAAQDGRRLYGIWLDDELVGGVLFPAFNARSGVAEIGAFLGTEARGRGIVTQAVAAMVRYCFEERGLHRVEWRCAPGNLPSRAVAQRLGFTHEGTLRQVFDIRGRKVDLEMWALLREDWPPGAGRLS
jgi:RimJ/RimL family protein N-acetyltransferase